MRLTVTRIDHVLGGKGWQSRASSVGPDLGSPHRPLLVDLEWTGPQLSAPTSHPAPQALGIKVVPVPSMTPSTAMSSAVTPSTVMPPTWPNGITSPPPASTAAAPPSMVTPPPITGPGVDLAIARAMREHRLVVGMSMAQAKEALNDWEGPVEIPASLNNGWKLFRWKRGDERIGAAFDTDGQLRSSHKM